MASNLEFVQFVCDQLGEQVSCRRMFGEYGLFAHGKYFACVCGNQLFFKATPGGRMLLGSALGSCQLEPPYPGAAPYLLVTQLEDRELLSRLLEATCRELPEPKPRKKRAGKYKAWRQEAAAIWWRVVCETPAFYLPVRKKSAPRLNRGGSVVHSGRKRLRPGGCSPKGAFKRIR